MREKYDIVVVGAGPAGSMAARAAARAGAKVLMLDKRRELGVPVQCGEALNEDVLKELNIEPDPRWALGKMNAVKLVSPSGIEVRIAERKVVGKVGYILDRKIFDKHLATLAAKEGADIMVGTLVDGLILEDGKPKGVKARGTNGRLEVRAEVIIAADGVGSRVARWAGLNTALKLDDIETGIQFQMIGINFESSSMMEFYFGNKVAPGGYCWVFPKGEDMANVGLGVLGSRAER
ncbi:MAG: geranylgeranyl reductase family protein, partial [Candidatus Hadarchaeaceae archaeon]